MEKDRNISELQKALDSSSNDLQRLFKELNSCKEKNEELKREAEKNRFKMNELQ